MAATIVSGGRLRYANGSLSIAHIVDFPKPTTGDVVAEMENSDLKVVRSFEDVAEAQACWEWLVGNGQINTVITDIEDFVYTA